MVKSNKKPGASGKPEDERQTVLDYLRKTNRPYSAVDVFNNLHGAVGKTQLQKILSQLVESKEVLQKAYGKQTIYTITQEQSDIHSAEDLGQMDQKIEQLKMQIADLKEVNNQKKTTLNSLNSSLTTQQIQTKLDELAIENQHYESKLAILQSGAQKITTEDKQRIESEYNNSIKIYKTRKRLFNDILDTITQSMEEMSPKAFKECIGIEEDPGNIKELLLIS